MGATTSEDALPPTPDDLGGVIDTFEPPAAVVVFDF